MTIVDGETIFGSTEAISIFESFSNFNGKLSIGDIIARYPKTKMYSHDELGYLVSKHEVLNRFRLRFKICQYFIIQIKAPLFFRKIGKKVYLI